MRLLHVTPFYEPAPGYGGMARASAGLCRALARRGHDVTVATALLDPAHPQEETLGGVRVRRLPGPALLRRFLVPWAPGLRSFLDSVLPTVDLAHLHGHRTGLAAVAAPAFAAAGVPWILEPHGTFPSHGQRPLLKWVFDRLIGDRLVADAAGLLAVSEAEARDLPRRARVVANGAEPLAAAGVVPARRPDAPLLFVGNDRPQKRGGTLTAVLAAIPGVDLHLVGPFRSGFLRAFQPFAARVRMRGVLDAGALAAAYAEARLLLHPAVGEAFGLVPFEAALHGTAAVVAGGHGSGEWYGRAGGCVVPPDDSLALVEAVRRRLREPVIADAEARAAAAFAARELTWEAAAEAVEALYRETLARRRRGAA